MCLHGPSSCLEWIIQNRLEHIGKSPDLSEDSRESEENSSPEPEETTVAVGKFCCCRMRLYHGMAHFKRRLSNYVCSHISRQMEYCNKDWEVKFQGLGG